MLQNQIEQRKQSFGGLALQFDSEGQKQIAVELYDRFHAMKTYGKEPESLESIIRIFKKDLSNYPTQAIMKAISIHSQRSQEFPTVSDISGIIKRKGRPPIKESDVIAVRKKDGQDRTPDDWALLREWDEQQRHEEFGEEIAVEDYTRLKDETIRLRLQIKELQNENKRLAQLLRNEQLKNSQPKESISQDERLENTVKHMRETGAPESDINDFVFEARMSKNAEYRSDDTQEISGVLGKLIGNLNVK